MVVAGIMTGTSVDAIDIAVCEVTNEGGRHSVSLCSFISQPFTEETLEAIKQALASTASMETLSDVPFLLARDYATAVRAVPQDKPIELVAIHGQTLWHNPPVSTWQAGCGSALSALVALPVVNDFRSADIILGGQGAPLVPIFDHAMLSSTSLDRVALNIGGMANVTILPRSASLENISAFDTGPGNVWIDTAIRSTFGKRYDTDGHVARAGRIIEPMLAECMTIPYFQNEPPKSTGRELFSDKEARRLITKYSHPSGPLEDVVTTMTELTAWSIADHIARYAPATNEIITSGGGSQNVFLLERLRFHLHKSGLKADLQVHTQWDAKEAMAFAYLGWLTCNGLPGNVPTVTGATRAVPLGSISKAF
ncbi:MAG: anhydro-N-acetylmuramic acid kinase [Candidatus Kapabacteria bacterium]|nr:anhydro-N-acetylmuramic acid kinase [Candidatus Kapabacteria bacterium]